ncbi:MAG: Fe-S cluster assembly protein SufB [Spirochaetales bacterium]|nr:Fe-S cluster assembly protein SufB [Spirochaetales bacterium]
MNLPEQRFNMLESEYKYGFHDPENYVYKAKPGLSHKIVSEISWLKDEPEWMQKIRHRALDYFFKKKLPKWGPFLGDIPFDDIYYYIKPSEKQETDWKDVPEGIRNTFDKLGIPEAEKKYLAGVGAQYESEVVYHSLREEWTEQGVVFLDMDGGLREYPEILKEYFGSVVPYTDNKFAALNTAVWSGGSFVYVPEGVEVAIPLQAYFRINAKNMGQFERTLIIAEKGSRVHYIEGCTAPIYSTDSLHSAVVEIVVKEGARVTYSTVQNWSKNVYNLVTKRSLVLKDGLMEWVDGNLGSGVSMKYPGAILKERGARAEVLSVAMASEGQQQDVGSKVVHMASDTSSTIVSKSISKSGGRSSFRGLVKVIPGLSGVKASVRCDALIMDDESRSDTYPYLDINSPEVEIGHEATVTKIGEEKLFYLMSRGISEIEASKLIVNGFIEPVVKRLPMEFAVEMNRLIDLEIEGSVG